MRKGEAGFTLVELLIAMTVFVLTIAAATAIFVPLLTQFKQQSRIAESNIEGMTGLEILRKDIEHAGFGVPWNILTGIEYDEAGGNAPANTDEPTTGGTTSPPRAVFSVNDITGYPNVVEDSDYLVIKSTLVATNAAVTKWTEVKALPGGPKTVRQWNSPSDDLKTGDKVMVIIPSRGLFNQRVLVTDPAGNFSVTFDEAYYGSPLFPDDFSPTISGDIYLIYGVAPPDVAALRMPFNRADYYVSLENVPARCAPGTGVLRKAVLNHTGTFAGGIHPLLDCVADMQVIYWLDTDGDGEINGDTNDLSLLSAQEIREQVKEVRVLILAHEGQRDVNYTFPNNSISTIAEDGAFGINFDLTTIANYQNYRWQVYRLAVKPKNIRG